MHSSGKVPREALARQAARRGAPSTGGVKRPNRGSFAVWGERAEEAIRYSMEADDSSSGDDDDDSEDDDSDDSDEREKKSTRYPSRIARDASYDDNMTQDRELAYTPVRSLLHIELLKHKGIFDIHPWAKFILWFNSEGRDVSSVFSALQCIDVPAYLVQLVYITKDSSRDIIPFVLFTDKRTGVCTRFFIYGGENMPVIEPPCSRPHAAQSAADPEQQLGLLQHTILASTPHETNQKRRMEAESIYDHVLGLTTAQQYNQHRKTKYSLICTPVCTYASIGLMQSTGILSKHPWACFLQLFRHSIAKDSIEAEGEILYGYQKVFSPMQRLDMPLYTIQFVYNAPSERDFIPYVMLTLKFTGMVSYYFLYGDYHNVSLTTASHTHTHTKGSSSSQSKQQHLQPEFDLRGEYTRLREDVKRLERQ